MTWTFNLQRAMVMTRTHAKYKSQKLFGSKAGVETGGQTDATGCSTLPANEVGKYPKMCTFSTAFRELIVFSILHSILNEELRSR